MIPTLEERVTDLEKLHTDLPEIMNLRFSRVETALRENATRFDEIAGRLNLLDTQMGMMIRDMRDLRGGVTRQLVGQDGRLATMETRLTAVETQVAALATLMETRLTPIEEKLDAILARLPTSPRH